MKAVVFTLGCKVNECESNSLIAGLIERGYEVYDELVPADLYVVNTCAVTSEAEKKSRQTASRILRLNPKAKIIFTGCAAEKDPSAFIKKSGDYLVTGVFGKGKILSELDRTGQLFSEKTDIYEELPTPVSLKTRAYVKVQDGCDSFCSYCVIPYLRGRSRSRSADSVAEEVIKLGAAETIINGINLSDYDCDGKGLTGLIEKLKGAKTRIRLGSLEVRGITAEFLAALSELNDFAPHFHLSLQSGSDAVLKKMNRKYTRAEFIEKVALIREYFPIAGITTDIIAGFPTESEEDFEKTLSITDEVKFSDIHPFSFSPRIGTAAAKMPDLPAEIKKERLDRLLVKKSERKLAFAKNMAGKTLSVIAEEFNGGFTEGYSENYLRVYIPKEIPSGEKIKVKIAEPIKDGAIGLI